MVEPLRQGEANIMATLGRKALGPFGSAHEAYKAAEEAELESAGGLHDTGAEDSQGSAQGRDTAFLLVRSNDFFNCIGGHHRHCRTDCVRSAGGIVTAHRRS